MRSVFSSIVQVAPLTLALIGVAAIPDPARGDVMVFYNGLDSAAEIQQGQVGGGGTFGSGSFIPGVVGNAYVVNSASAMSTFFPASVIPVDAGRIEFDAKLIGFPTGNLGSGQNPTFITTGDPTPNHSTFLIGLNGNDGAGNGGLTGQAGDLNFTGTGLYGTWTYSQVLGVGHEADWHQYDLVWNKDGIPGLNGAVVAVYLDGVLNSTRWQTNNFGGTQIRGPGPFDPLGANANLFLGSSQEWQPGESVAIDELRVFATVPEPSTLALVTIGVVLVGLKRWFRRRRFLKMPAPPGS